MDKGDLEEFKESFLILGKVEPKFRDMASKIIKSTMKRYVLDELGIEGDVIAMYQYGSQVYGTADENSDYDYIIVMKSALLPSGAFRDNAISNEDRTIQGVVYSRGGFQDALNNYEISALECLSLPSNFILEDKWSFNVSNWDNKRLVKAIIKKASDSLHYSKMASKNGDKERAIRSMYHSLRILHFGIQLKANKKIVDFKECNDLFLFFQKLTPESFDTRKYFHKFEGLVELLKKA